MKKKFNKILLLGRKNDHSVSLLIKFLKKNSNKLVVVWSKHPKEKDRFQNRVGFLYTCFYCCLFN